VSRVLILIANTSSSCYEISVIKVSQFCCSKSQIVVATRQGELASVGRDAGVVMQCPWMDV
jgi:hypothetical protein